MAEVYEQAFRAHVAKDGERHPVTRGLEGAKANPPAWGQWFRQIDATPVKGQTLLSGANDKPLLMLSREGKGRVACCSPTRLWLWARGYDGGGPHVDLTRRLAHWLLKEPELEEELLRATTAGRDIAVERQSLKDAPEPLVATTPSGEKSEMAWAPKEPGLYRADIHNAQMGLYRFESGGLTALANVGPQNPREFREVASTGRSCARSRRRRAARCGGCRRAAAKRSCCRASSRCAELSLYGGADWIGVRHGAATALKGVRTTPLALGLSALCALLGRGDPRLDARGTAVIWAVRADHVYSSTCNAVSRRREEKYFLPC